MLKVINKAMDSLRFCFLCFFNFCFPKIHRSCFFNYRNLYLLQQITASNLSSFIDDDANKMSIYHRTTVFFAVLNLDCIVYTHIFCGTCCLAPEQCTAWWIGSRVGDIFRNIRNKTFLPNAKSTLL